MKLFPIFHPAAALRTPRVKEQLREDFAKLPALLVEEPPQRDDGERRRSPEPEAEPGRRPDGPVRLTSRRGRASPDWPA